MKNDIRETINIIKKLSEAIPTDCQTPETKYKININNDMINIYIKLPIELNIDQKEAEILEANIHNSIEIMLSKYFN